MTISRVNGSGWGVGDKLTSSQANSLDLNGTYALDKRSGQTDTLQSIVSCSGAGRLVPTYVAGSDSNATLTLSNGINVVNASSGLTANRTYTFSNTGGVAGDTCLVLGNPTYDVTVKNAAAATLLVVGAANTGNNQSRWGEFLFDGSVWVLLRSSYGPQQLRQTFSGNGTYTVPADCYKLLVVGAGGGGGGGAGAAGSTTAGNKPAGGGGGGAAMMGSVWVDTTPGATFSVTVGTGGNGSTSSANGADGTSTTFGSTLSFRGGQGGNTMTTLDTADKFPPGGGPTQGGVTRPNLTTWYWGVYMPGEGGYGSVSGRSAAPGALPHISATLAGSGTTTAGTAGTAGATSGSTLGGGGGGGGGASAFGNGGNAGNGGDGAVSASPGNPGTAGSVGGTSAGGGAGGAGGNNTGGGAGGAGGNGGNGGNGALVVIPIR